MSSVLDQARAGLKHYFQYDDFRGGQSEAVETLLNGEDLCVIMPTGAGKSICYQLPALLLPSFTIVISPLIALMKDQVDALVARNIPAAFLNSTQTSLQQQGVMDALQQGQIKLLYVAPERLRIPAFRQQLKALQPQMLVVDEAHCISQWGHDFRPDYQRIGEYAEEMEIRQLAAFTATATPTVQKDIVTQLHRPEMKTLITGFSRKNLHFSVMNASGKQKNAILGKYLKKKEPTIIYCSSRKNVDSVCEEFDLKGYHAGLNDKEREEAQEYFINDPCPVLVATNAFGMGIDRADIRRVIHYNFPGSVEAYYQEAGRAGRDNKDSECIMFYSMADKFIHEFLIDMNNPDERYVHALWDELLEIREETQSDSLEVPTNHLAGEVGLEGKEQMVSGCLKILEQNKYIERGYKGHNKGFISFNGDLKQLFEHHSQIRTQRSIFTARMISAFGEQLSFGMEASYFDLERVSGLNSDQLKRVLRALSEEHVVWRAPFNGRAINLMRFDADLQVDFSKYYEKKDFELSRLGEVMHYANVFDCRQKALVEYFGEKVDKAWRCGTCDLCTKKKPEGVKFEAKDNKVVLNILKAVKQHSSYIGRKKLVLLLTGSKSKEITGGYLGKSPHYAALRGFDQDSIMKYVDSLLAKGYIEMSRGKYPVLEIASEGERAIIRVQADIAHFNKTGERRSSVNNESSLRSQARGSRQEARGEDSGPLFSNKKKPSQKTESREQRTEKPKERSGPLFGGKEAEKKREPKRRISFDDLDAKFGLSDEEDEPVQMPVTDASQRPELYEKLRAMRNRIAKDMNLQPFQVCNNFTLQDMTVKAPSTLSELEKVRGIGPQKAQQWGKVFLAIIAEWRG